MSWWGLIFILAGFAGLMAVFVLWDMIFCGGKRCEQLIDQLIDRMNPR